MCDKRFSNQRLFYFFILNVLETSLLVKFGIKLLFSQKLLHTFQFFLKNSIFYEDRAVHDKYQWDSAIKFLEKSLNDKLSVNEQTLRELVIIFCFKWAIPGLFFLNFCLSNTDLIQLSVYKMSEVTALPTEPQPLPIIFLFLLLYGVTKHVSCYFIITIQLEVAINVMTSS